jgi:hypothetical protein
MIAVRVMQASVYKVVDVVTVRYGLVSAIRAMRVIWALGSRSALRRIRGIDREDMLVNMIPMHVMEMAVMNIVDVAIMADRRMAAGRSVLMGMVGMVLLGTGGHWSIPFVSEKVRALISFLWLGLSTSKRPSGARDEPSQFIRFEYWEALNATSAAVGVGIASIGWSNATVLTPSARTGVGFK